MSMRLASRERSLPEASCVSIDAVPVVPPPALVELLSDREEQIAVLAARGLSNKQIGQRLGISPWTVATHLRRTFLKLDITRRIELCAIVATLG